MAIGIAIYRDPRRKKPWVVRWRGEYDPAIGKQRFYSRAFRTKAEAEDFKSEQHHQFNKGVARDKRRTATLAGFCKDWLRTRKGELKPASFELYEQTVKRLNDYFGAGIPLKDISQQEAAEFISKQVNLSQHSKGKPLSDWSLAQIKRHCRTIFEAAVDWQLLAVNPFKALRFKKLATKRWYRLTVPEYHALLEIVPSLREKVAYALFYTAGLRLHEAFALTWDSVDFENGVVVINNREGSANVPEFSIKDCEKRRIPLPPHTIDLLTRLHAEATEKVPFVLLTKERYELVKQKWHQICEQGKPWKNRYLVNNVLRKFKKYFKRAGIKPVGKFTVHTLRKNAGQNWADYLPMNVVKELMGHSSIATTAEFYNQVDRDHELKAARVIQSLLESNKNATSPNKPCADFAPKPILDEITDEAK